MHSITSDKSMLFVVV